MKKNSLTIVMAILSVLLFAEEYSLKSLEFTLTKEVNDIFSIGATLKTEPNTNVISMYHGKVVDINRDSNNSTNLGKYVEIATIFNYYLSGENKKVEFHMIYSNLSSIAEDIDIGYEINTQKVIGITGEKSSPLMKSDDLMISMYTLSREFYLEYYTSNYSTEMLNLYWYSIVSILYGKIPNPNIFKYEEIDTENIDYNELEINKSIRFYYILSEYPKIQYSDFINLYMIAVLSGLIENTQIEKYEYIEYIENPNVKVMLLWPEEIVKSYKKHELKGKKVYLFGRKVAQNDDGILIVIDLSSDLSPEQMMSK